MATLIVHTQGTLVEARGGHLRLMTPDGLRTELPLVGIDRLHAYGKVQITTQALTVLAEAGKEVAWFSCGGRLRARLAVNPVGSGVAVRRAQYRAADDPAYALELAQRLTAAKIANMRAVLLRAWRSRPERNDEVLAQRLQQAIDALDEAQDLDSVRGIEGAATKAYYAAWAALMAGVFPWSGRNRRPPRDPLNVLLSFGYTLLANEVQAQAEAVGLDPWLGFLHAERPGHAALASDLMEPLRPVLVDRVILDLVSHLRLGWQHFESHAWQSGRQPMALDDAEPTDDSDTLEAPTEVPRLTDEGRKVFLTAWERRLSFEDADDGGVIGGRKMLADQVASFARSLREGNPALYVPHRLRT
ncbi:MAG: CRISPR-associated endonuclease Cas1 [Planctomycetes bacterium]|nr:CRISPR-associated endonuclease Cas1 [Planctomycetota bacterium]